MYSMRWRCYYLVGDPGLVVSPLASPVPDDEQLQRAVVLGRVLQPGQLRGARRAAERGHGHEREDRAHASGAARHSLPWCSSKKGQDAEIDEGPGAGGYDI